MRINLLEGAIIALSLMLVGWMLLAPLSTGSPCIEL